MDLYFGQVALRGELRPLTQRQFNLVELVAAPGLPKASKLQALLQSQREGTALSLVLDAAAFEQGPAAESALALAERLLSALSPRLLVLRPPGSFRPGNASEQRLASLAERLRGPSHRLVWEPGGLWQARPARALAERLNIIPVQRIEEFEPAPCVYVRLVQLGVGRSRLNSNLEEFAEQLAECEEAYVVLEGQGAPRIYSGLRSALSELELNADSVGDEADDFDSDDEDFDADEGEALDSDAESALPSSEKDA